MASASDTFRGQSLSDFVRFYGRDARCALSRKQVRTLGMPEWTDLETERATDAVQRFSTEI